MRSNIFASRKAGSASREAIASMHVEPEKRPRNPLADSVARNWFNRASNFGWKPGSAAYKKAEVEFAVGAAAAINALCPNPGGSELLSDRVPAGWFINIMRGDPVFKDPDIRVLREVPDAVK